MSKHSSGGSGHGEAGGCGWFLGMVALVAAIGSLCVSVSVGAGPLTGGAIGMDAESHGLAGVFVVVALVALWMARGEER